MRRLATVLAFVFLATTGMTCWQPEGQEPTPEAALAEAELAFQGVQDSIQELIRTGLVNSNNAQCVKDANTTLKGGLDQARNAVRLDLPSEALAVSAFRAALLDISRVVTQIEGGTYRCTLSTSLLPFSPSLSRVS